MADKTTLDKNIDTVARSAVWVAFEDWAEEGWESMPDIGEYDYERVVEAAKKLLPPDVTSAQFDSAISALEARAEGVPP